MPGNIISITAADIRAWPNPNYVDPMRRQWMPVYAGTLYAVASLMVATRFWLRLTKRAGAVGLDDLLLFVAWIAGTLFTCILIISTTQFELDRHIWDVRPHYYVNTAQMTWLAEFAFLVCGGCTKISVLLFYTRLVGGAYTKRWKWAFLLAIFFTAAYSISFIGTLVFNCSPTNAYWKAFNVTYTRKYTCVDTTVINLLAGVLAIVSDLYSVVLPCLMTRHYSLEMTTRQRLALNVIFSLGLLVVGASAVRTYYLYEVGHSSDVTWLVFDVFVWAHLELQLGFLCASAPALRIFVRNYLGDPIDRIRRASQLRLESAPASADMIQRLDGHRVKTTRHDVSRSPWTKSHGVQISMTSSEAEISPVKLAHSDQFVLRHPIEHEAFTMQGISVALSTRYTTGNEGYDLREMERCHHAVDSFDLFRTSNQNSQDTVRREVWEV